LLQAVIGGGAAGLISARELLKAGHRVTIFEQSPNIGGVWDYVDETDDDPLGRGSVSVHGSMYKGEW
jgi:cation diffusion facilitator CzcD-associated flavoprotein CzcO